MESNSEYSKENYITALDLLEKHKNYHKEKNLIDRINSFEFYKYARNWIKKYEKLKCRDTSGGN